jgi:hypothetical protein
MTHRFFRADAATYTAILDQLNHAWGLPANGQLTAFAFAADAPKDDQGRCYVAVRFFYCDYEPVASILPDLLASGAIEEIDAADYWAAVV